MAGNTDNIITKDMPIPYESDFGSGVVDVGLSSPRYRASILKSQLSGIDRALSREEGRAILAQLPDQFVHEIKNALAPEWIRMPGGDCIAEAILEVLGRERAVEFWRTQTLHFAELQIFRSFVKTLIRMLSTPERLLKSVIHAASLVTKDLGDQELTVGKTARSAKFVVTNIPHSHRTEGRVAAWEGTFLGSFDLMNLPCKVKSDVRRLAGGKLRITIQWT